MSDTTPGAIYRARLATLAEFLNRHNEQKDKWHFNFRVIAMGMNEQLTCGTQACALGCLPILWPDVFGYELEDRPSNIDGARIADVIFKNRPVHDPYKSEAWLVAQKWFGISELHCKYLFMDHNDGFSFEDENLDLLLENYHGNSLDGDATAQQVAYNIGKYLEHHFWPDETLPEHQ